MSIPITIEPRMGDTPGLSAMKINTLTNLAAGRPLPPPGSGLLSLDPSRGDSMEMSLKKINGCLVNSARALPTIVACPQTVFSALNTWYDIMPPVTLSLSHTGYSMVMLASSFHFSWVAGNNAEAICDWSTDATVHYKRTWHKRTSGNTFIGGVDLNFFTIVQGYSPTITLQGRQVEGPLNLTVIPRNDPVYPELESVLIIFDMGPLNP